MDKIAWFIHTIPAGKALFISRDHHSIPGRPDKHIFHLFVQIEIELLYARSRVPDVYDSSIPNSYLASGPSPSLAIVNPKVKPMPLLLVVLTSFFSS